MKASDVKVCVFCDVEASFQCVGTVISQYCPECGGYKGLMLKSEWEAYTGEKWEDN